MDEEDNTYKTEQEDSDWECEMFNNKDFTTSEIKTDTMFLEADNTRVNTQNCNRHTCCVACRRMHKALLEKMDILIDLISNQQKRKLLSTTNSECAKSVLPNFPLSTTEEFIKFNEDLKKDKNLQVLFETNIAVIGGRNAEHNVRNILKYVFTDDLCRYLSWTGQKGSIPIKDTMISSIITEYICGLKLLDIYTIRKIIGEWMRHAGDRVRYKTKTEKQTDK